MEAKDFSLKTLLAVYIGLTLLLFLTVVAALIPLGSWSPVVSLLIAAAKTFLIVYFFMKLGLASSGLRVVAAAGLFWLCLLGFITMGDYMTRFSFGVLGK